MDADLMRLLNSVEPLLQSRNPAVWFSFETQPSKPDSILMTGDNGSDTFLFLPFARR